MTARTVITIDPTVSILERTGFVRPPVVPDEPALNNTVPPWMIADTLPPPMTARDHLKRGDSSLIKEAVVMMPAKIARGVIRLSYILSTHGI